MTQQAKLVNVGQSYVPGDPNALMVNLGYAQREDQPVESFPILPVQGYNFMPTAYGYRSYFGMSTIVNPTIPGTCDEVLQFQRTDFRNIHIALCSNGVHTLVDGIDTAWDHAWVLPDDFDTSGIYNQYSHCIIENDLYIYRQGADSVLKLDNTGVVSFHTPTFLNMAGQIGIFRANSRLGFWDSLNSISWSDNFDLFEFTPSLETLVGNMVPIGVKGRIMNIVPHGEGFIIYATQSIVGISYNSQGTNLWDSMTLTSIAGVAHPKAITVGENDKQHFIYATNGIFKIGHFNALSRQYDLEQLVPELFDFLKEDRSPVYIQCFKGRYIFFTVLSENYINGVFRFFKPEERTPFKFTPLYTGAVTEADGHEPLLMVRTEPEDPAYGVAAFIDNIGGKPVLVSDTTNAFLVNNADAREAFTSITASSMWSVEGFIQTPMDIPFPDPATSGDYYDLFYITDGIRNARFQVHARNTEAGIWRYDFKVYMGTSGNPIPTNASTLKVLFRATELRIQWRYTIYNGRVYFQFKDYGVGDWESGSDILIQDLDTLGVFNFPMSDITEVRILSGVTSGENTGTPWVAHRFYDMKLEYAFGGNLKFPYDIKSVVFEGPPAQVVLGDLAQYPATVLETMQLSPEGVPLAITYTPATLELQQGSPLPAYPTLAGAFVFDLALKKWGKFLAPHKALYAASPVNATQDDSVPYTNFVPDIAVLSTDGSSKLLGVRPATNELWYGFFGLTRLGFTNLHEVRLGFRFPVENLGVTIYGSLDGKNIDSRFTKDVFGLEGSEVVIGYDKSARWFAVALTGQFDLTDLNFVGSIASRR